MTPHPIHDAWMKEVSNRRIKPYIPNFLFFGRHGLRNFPKIAQIVSFLNGLFVPSSKLYLIEGPATVPCVYFKKGIVISINSDTFFYNLKHSSYLVRLYSKFLLKRIDGFISTSNFMQKQTNKSSEVVYPFVDVKNLLNIKPNFDNQNICNISGMRYTKGTDILIETFEKFREISPQAKLFALGEEGETINWIDKINAVGGIAPGRIPIINYLKQSSIYLNPARYEPFGVNILEAMAAGIPPLVSEYCGSAEIVKKVDQRLVISLNPMEIVKKIIWLKSNRKKYYELSKKCKDETKKYTKEKSICKFKEKFTRLVKKIK